MAIDIASLSLSQHHFPGSAAIVFHKNIELIIWSYFSYELHSLISKSIMLCNIVSSSKYNMQSLEKQMNK